MNKRSLLPVSHQHSEPGNKGSVKRRMSWPTWSELSDHRVLRVMRRTRHSTSTRASIRATILARNIPLMPQPKRATNRILNTPIPSADKMPVTANARLLPNPRNTWEYTSCSDRAMSSPVA